MGECQYQQSYDCRQTQHLYVQEDPPPHTLSHACAESRSLFLSENRLGFDVTQELETGYPDSNSASDFDSEDEVLSENSQVLDDDMSPSSPVEEAEWMPLYHDESTGHKIFQLTTRKELHRRAMKNVLFPCYHASIIHNKNRGLYWNPSIDIIDFRAPVILNPDTYQDVITYMWCQNGYLPLRVNGVKNVAMGFQWFAEWIMQGDEFRIFEGLEIVYVILRKEGNDEEKWKCHMSMFKAWYGYLRTRTRLKEFGDREKDGFKVKIMWSVDGMVDEYDYARAVDVEEFEGYEVFLANEEGVEDVGMPLPADEEWWRRNCSRVGDTDTLRTRTSYVEFRF